jgi:sugar phosphate permease
MIRTLQFNRTAGGSVFNAYLIVYILVTPFVGYLTDKLGARLVITTCSFILAAGVLLMGTVQSLLTACIFFSIAGLGSTGMWTPAMTLVQRWFVFRRRGLALGVLSVSYGLGYATMGVLIPWVVHCYSWRIAWYFLGSLALGMVAVNGIFLKSDPKRSGYEPWGERNSLPDMRVDANAARESAFCESPFRSSTFWLIGCSYYSICYSLYGITTFMVDYARYQLGFPLAQAGLLATIHGILQIVGVLLIMPLSDHLGRKRTIILANAFICIAITGIVFDGTSWVILCFLVGCVGIFYGAAFPLYAACAGDYFPDGVMGTVIGGWAAFFGLGAVATHWVSGIIRDTTGIYGPAFFIDAIAAALGLFLMCLVEKNKTQKQNASS